MTQCNQSRPAADSQQDGNAMIRVITVVCVVTTRGEGGALTVDA